MITAVYTNSQNRSLEIFGHAEFSSFGNDIVCSAVSVLTQFVAEILKNESLGQFEKREGYLKISLNQETYLSNLLLDYLLKSLVAISKDYPRNLKVEVR
ncbi:MULTISPECIES: ribosomal-processing cysteine protease Prp [Petrotoga]|uniref:Ribosomal processing cysteine protease Prp n=2 Tax=Petrotoga sibirica TaxID=156202 RepID=A0A4V6QAE4_9BACT|nr:MULTISPECIES: ribosomal-processing cysteine protease Prp [Petrotoga]KUK83230.1 MAG: Uncharacterized protein XD96_0445 [Petrotoga mobilis]POZ88931.1 hypothetical protein AA80_03395 [Petrotoga sibirica DSM 13575]POZ91168.1 hypothetical protein AD60_04215 [Petrotoga sp. SL27]TDX15553.1 hypothetical protein C8D74_10636 [Petrotoga sibirica]